MNFFEKPKYIILLLLVASVYSAVLGADEGYVVIRNVTNHPWTLKVVNGINPATNVAAALLDLARGRALPFQTEVGTHKPGYWDIGPAGTYCLCLRADTPIVYEFALGGSNRNYRVFLLKQTNVAGEPRTAVAIAGSRYLKFNADTMLDIANPATDPVVRLDGPAAVSIQAENYPAGVPGEPDATKPAH